MIHYILNMARTGWQAEFEVDMEKAAYAPPLVMARRDEDQAHAEVTKALLDGIAAASWVSVHHGWLTDIQEEWPQEGEPNLNRLSFWAMYLKQQLKIHGLYPSEQKACRRVADAIERYVKARNRLITAEYQAIKEEA